MNFFSFFTHFFQSSQLLTDARFDEMCRGAVVLEQDGRGAKVLQLPSGDIVKIFRVKRMVSGAHIYSYARRFCRNAKRLAAQAVPTVKIKTLYHFEEGNNTAVLYEPLAGHTLRQLIHAGETDLSLAAKLGVFLAELHRKGIHFHSLHTGNVVQTPRGDLGLIDISDMSIYAWPLFCHTRIRSFKRLCKYQDDIKKLGFESWRLLQDKYFVKSRLTRVCESKIRQAISKSINF